MNYIPISSISGGGRSLLGSLWGPVAFGGFRGPVSSADGGMMDFGGTVAEKIAREHPG